MYARSFYHPATCSDYEVGQAASVDPGCSDPGFRGILLCRPKKDLIQLGPMAKKTKVADIVNNPKLEAAFTAYVLSGSTRRVALLVGGQIKVPLDPANGGGVKCAIYMNLTMDECLTAMTYYNGVATALYETDQLAQALQWTLEVDVLHKDARFAAHPIFDWEIFHPLPACLEFHRQRLLGLMTASDVLLKFGNTGSAAYCRNLGQEVAKSLPSGVDELSLRRELIPWSSIIYRSLDIKYPDLQVRGSWQRLKWRESSRVTSCMAHACFIHKSRLYVCGGQRSGTLELYPDVWCLDLVKMNGWREVPSYKQPFLNCQMVVHEGKAYLCRGYAQLDYLDLERESWGGIQTHFVDERGKKLQWPFHRGLTDYTANIDSKLYVFGGKYGRPIGCNYYYVLDFATRTWRHLSGAHDSVPLKQDYDQPGVRKNYASWVDPGGKKIYILYSMADRQAVRLFETEFASSEGFVYDDCWSWDIAEKNWQRERVAGNFPCPRAEMSLCYNPAMKQTILFGGYRLTRFGLNHFSDTFILDHSGPGHPRWRKVIIGNFPTYRAQGQLVVDPATGRTYLFGGYTNTDWIPTGKHDLTRSYGELWEFRGLDWEDDRRAALLGPWMSCYACRSIGVWKRCGGASSLRQSDLSKDGWPEHKEKHGCRARK
ncbi:hypothetical protein C8Q77DRAFT_1220832 [Trametes polyzona]|nr:hypothetical protein C8Q77DRAFT_1220832 [Trametes polyzona]